MPSLDLPPSLGGSVMSSCESRKGACLCPHASKMSCIQIGVIVDNSGNKLTMIPSTSSALESCEKLLRACSEHQAGVVGLRRHESESKACARTWVTIISGLYSFRLPLRTVAVIPTSGLDLTRVDSTLIYIFSILKILSSQIG